MHNKISWQAKWFDVTARCQEYHVIHSKVNVGMAQRNESKSESKREECIE